MPRGYERSNMNYQKFVDSICESACILSVKMLPDSDAKEINIVTCNSAFEELLRTSPESSKESFVQNTSYDRYFQRSSSIDDMTIQAAILKIPAHKFTAMEDSDVWANLTWIPLTEDEESEDIFYCCLVVDISEIADPKDSIDTSNGLSNTLLEICGKMNYSTNMIDAVKGLLSDITNLCNTEGRFCVMSMDKVNKKALIVTVEGQSDVIDASFGQSMGKDLYKVAEDWIRDFGDDDCILVKTPADLEKYKELDPAWVDSLINFSVEKLAMMPLISQKEIVGFIWASLYPTPNFEKEDINLMKNIIEKVRFAVANIVANYQVTYKKENLE
ncbi:hypothetical protein SAMN02910370_02422 [Lachnospiraceae bacterium XPB1003]|nr:hypothetical protein SAMN02910370_02422 [Lachnospiraceae bacterium XPB1003]